MGLNRGEAWSAGASKEKRRKKERGIDALLCPPSFLNYWSASFYTQSRSFTSIIQDKQICSILCSFSIDNHMCIYAILQSCFVILHNYILAISNFAERIYPDIRITLYEINLVYGWNNNVMYLKKRSFYTTFSPHRNCYSYSMQNCIFGFAWFSLCDFRKPIAMGFPQLEWQWRASKAAHVEDAKFHRKPRDDGERNTRRRAERAALGPSLWVSSQGDCRILKYFLATLLSLLPDLHLDFLPLAFSFSCGISRSILLVSHAVHEQS